MPPVDPRLRRCAVCHVYGFHAAVCVVCATFYHLPAQPTTDEEFAAVEHAAAEFAAAEIEMAQHAAWAAAAADQNAAAVIQPHPQELGYYAQHGAPQHAVPDPAVGYASHVDPATGQASYPSAATGSGPYSAAGTDNVSQQPVATGHTTYPAASMGSSSDGNTAPVADMDAIRESWWIPGYHRQLPPPEAYEAASMGFGSDGNPAPVAQMGENPEGMWYSGYPADAAQPGANAQADPPQRRHGLPSGKGKGKKKKSP